MAFSGISILNDVIGPVMRGPSSSHTAGPFFIGKAIRSLLGRAVTQAEVYFDPDGSFAHVFREQRSDVGFIAGLLDMAITDNDFHRAQALADQRGVRVRFDISPLTGWTHPNTVRIRAIDGKGGEVVVVAESVGGGQIRLREINGTALSFRCHRPALLIVWREGFCAQSVINEVRSRGLCPSLETRVNADDASENSMICVGGIDDLRTVTRATARRNGCTVWPLPAIGLISYHEPEVGFSDVETILRLTRERQWSLGELGVNYEAQLLKISPDEAQGNMVERWQVMKAAVDRGLSSPTQGMRFLTTSSRQIHDANLRGELVCGGLLADSSAAALAVMEQNSSGGVICAAPTAGSAGIIPGLLHAVQIQCGLDDGPIARALFATGVVGVLIATRGTFAAETCACAAETGAAAAMAAAGLVELNGGTVAQELDAATMCLMNTIGLACDPVQGAVEIPCHARNLAGVAHALVAADCILGGFRAVLPLDQTIDAMMAVGRSLPSSIRCTSMGGLAATPAARSLVPLPILD